MSVGTVEIGILLQFGHCFQMGAVISMLMSETKSRSEGFCPSRNLVGSIAIWNRECSSKMSRKDHNTTLLVWLYLSAHSIKIKFLGLFFPKHGVQK